MVKLAVAGGNVAGSTIVSIFREDLDTEIVGLFEKDPNTPGSVLAKKWGIPLFEDIRNLIEKEKPEIIINVTSNRKLSETIRVLHPDVEVIDISGARFLWKSLEKKKKIMIELSKTIEDVKKVISMIDLLYRTEAIELFLEQILDAALEITNSMAGSVALKDDDMMTLYVSRGLSKGFTEKKRWQILSGGLTDLVLKKKEMIAISDLSQADYTNNPLLISEGIKALLACPIPVNGEIKGIIYLNDFKPRQYSDRQKRTLLLLCKVTGLAMDRIELLRRLSKKESELEELNNEFERRVKERTEALDRANKELERSSQHKNIFIANMSHELRTPLNSILGFSNVLLDKTFGELTETQERYVRNINSSGRYLLDLINNILDIAKIEAGKYDMSYEEFPIGSAIGEVINTMRGIAEKKNIQIEVEIDSVDSIVADKTKIKQIFYNLLSNAIKFTPEGGRIGVKVSRITIKRGEDLDEVIKCSVWDTGIGISAEDKEKIFDEFVQADSAFSRRYGGTGLGLALTKRLVELHGGNITVESVPGEGSTFSLSIPCVSGTRVKIPAEEVEAVRLNFPWMDEKAPLILIVEDDTASSELMTIHLTQAGYKVAHAFDGEEAIEKAKKLKPFAILLDIMLPKKDGWEVLQELKTDEMTSHIPVLIHSIVDNKDLGFALGATDYLLKPLDKTTLLEKLQGLSVLKAKKTPLTILIIASDGSLEYLKEALGSQEFLIYSAKDGKRGLELATALRPDIILLDLELPDMLGFEAIKELKEHPSTVDIPVFVLTEKDISIEERTNLMGKIERILRKQRFDMGELIDHIMEVEVLYPAKAGLVDKLTGLFSHRYFQIRLAQEVERAVRYKQPLNLLLLDIDFFGHYMKEHGEAEAAKVLKTVADLLRKNIRGSDVVVRYGGDSFAVILPNTVLSAALSLGNRFNAIIRNYPFPKSESMPKGRITASVGLAFLDGQDAEELILCCEKARAFAVKKGGDRVEIYSKEMEEEEEVIKSKG